MAGYCANTVLKQCNTKRLYNQLNDICLCLLDCTLGKEPMAVECISATAN